MTNREKLQDQYEDALFALLMDDLAWREGVRLLEENERLKNDPDAKIRRTPNFLALKSSGYRKALH